VRLSRAFRTEDSLRAEKATRELVGPFLSRSGYEVERDVRERGGQTITVRSTAGTRVSCRVKLCWRREGGRDAERYIRYSAAQLMAKAPGGDWVGGIRTMMSRHRKAGVTHMLFVQPELGSIRFAALVPVEAVHSVWASQRDIGDRMLAEGRTRRNHAQNGSSPTLWLQNDDAPELSIALWSYPGVERLTGEVMRDGYTPLTEEIIDEKRYMEGSCHRVVINAYERDSSARAACIRHHGTRCSICDFSFGDCYGTAAEGFIEVHHLVPLSSIGHSYKVNPVEDLRPVCPNCHAVIHMGGGCRKLDDVRILLTKRQGM